MTHRCCVMFMQRVQVVSRYISEKPGVQSQHPDYENDPRNPSRTKTREIWCAHPLTIARNETGIWETVHRASEIKDVTQVIGQMVSCGTLPAYPVPILRPIVSPFRTPPHRANKFWRENRHALFSLPAPRVLFRT